jgi:hypothetical protein
VLELAEKIAEVAEDLGIQTALIGAVALAAHNYVRGTVDVDLATHVDPGRELRRLQQRLESIGLHTRLNLPDEDDHLGGLLRVWQTEDEDGDPIEPVDVVNFFNPHRPAGINPGAVAIREAVTLDRVGRLRYVRLPELIALKLYAGSRRDQADVVELLVNNPDADLSVVRSVCRDFGFEQLLEELVREAKG